MSAEAILTVAAAVVALTQLLKWSGVSDKLGPLVVMAAALVGVVFWGWSAGDVTRASAFNYFAGWVTVSTSAAGVFGFTRASSEAISRTSSPPPGGAGGSATTTGLSG